MNAQPAPEPIDRGQSASFDRSAPFVFCDQLDEEEGVVADAARPRRPLPLNGAT